MTPPAAQAARQGPLYWAVYWGTRAFLGLSKGIAVEGLEFLPPSGKVIVAVNHISLIDPLLAGVAIAPRRFPCWLGKEELLRIPGMSVAFAVVGVIPLDRSRGDFSALRRARGVLEAEGCMVLFPEGTRSRTGRPGRPKAGVAFLARDSGAPVVPARVFNTESVFGRGPFRIRFGPALRYTGGPERSDGQRFAEEVMEAILKL